MTTLLIIAIYLIGCVLAYGRLYASFYEIDENYISWISPMGIKNFKGFALFQISMSWVTFLSGVLIYFTDDEKYFLKWSNKDLIERYNNRHD